TDAATSSRLIQLFIVTRCRFGSSAHTIPARKTACWRRSMIQLQPYGEAHNQPPLIAIPGLDGTIGSIEPVVRRLARHREVIVVDFSAERNQTLEMLVADIASALTSRQYPALDIMGQSIGTIFAA